MTLSLTFRPSIHGSKGSCERGSAATEYISVIALAVIVGASVIIGSGPSRGGQIGHAVGRALTHSVVSAGRAQIGSRHRGHRISTIGDLPIGARALHPQLNSPSMSLRRAEWQATRHTGSVQHRMSMHACLVCGGVDHELQHSLGAYAERGRTASAEPSLMIDGTLHPWLGIAEIDGQISSRWGTTNWGGTSVTSGRASVGADATAHALLSVNRHRQDLELGGGAVIGASGSMSHRTAIRLAGIGLATTVGAEGWIGAGAKGSITVHHDAPGVWSYETQWGAGLGLGGALRIAGSVDLSRVLTRSRAP